MGGPPSDEHPGSACTLGTAESSDEYEGALVCFRVGGYLGDSSEWFERGGSGQSLIGWG